MRTPQSITVVALLVISLLAVSCGTPQPTGFVAAKRAELRVRGVTRVPYKIRASIQDSVDTTVQKTTTLDTNWDIVEKDSQKIVVSSPSGRRRTFDRKVTAANPDLKASLVSLTDGKTRVVAIDQRISFGDEVYTVFDIRPHKGTVILMRKGDHARVVVYGRHAVRKRPK